MLGTDNRDEFFFGKGPEHNVRMIQDLGHNGNLVGQLWEGIQDFFRTAFIKANSNHRVFAPEGFSYQGHEKSNIGLGCTDA